MPKMKSHRGAAKRFKVTGTGKVRRRRANLNHMLGKKSANRKRRLSRPDAEVAPADSQRIRRLLAK
ncbi:MAG: 50S ribosomal protein L35 [Actinomycetota bacterium]